MRKTYLFDNTQLVIIDPDLNIDLNIPFNTLIIPKNQKTVHGLVKKRGEKGQLLCVYFEIEGRREGQFHRYYLNGRVECECFYSAGLLQGPSRFYSASGVCLSETWFYKDRKEGESKRYYLLGQLCSIERFRGGILHGRQEYYYEDGTIKSLLSYDQGKVDGEVTLYWPNGKKKRQCYFNKGVREGYDRMWSISGKVLDEGEYRGGAPVGLHSSFYNSGAPQEKRFYHTPQRYDYIEWDIEGSIQRQGIYDSYLGYEEKEWTREGD